MIGKILAAFVLLTTCATAADARPHHHYVRHHAYAAGVENTGYYTNVSGHSVHRPAHASGKPSGASAQCGDGTYSFSEHHRGTCSRHGGVSTWY